MLKIWGRSNSINVQKVMWMVEELGLAHERFDVGGAFGGLEAPEYVAMNPNRLIPVIDDDGVVLWESNTIVRYLAARHGAGTLWPEDPAERARAEMWMDWQLTTPQADMMVVFWGLIRTPPEQRDEAAITAAGERLGQIFARLDAHLQDRPFVAGEDFTMGDVPVGALCHRWLNLPLPRPTLAYLEAWQGRLQARPPFQRHVMLPLT